MENTLKKITVKGKSTDKKQSVEAKTIAGEETGGSHEGTKYWLSERSVGNFSRTVAFETPADQNGVSASFEDGILSVVIPKAQNKPVHRITIN